MATPPFPIRPLRLRVPAQGQPIFYILLTAGALLLAGFFLYLKAPDLLRDWRMLEANVPAKAARIVEGRCRSRLIVHWCDSRIEHRVGTELRSTGQSFMFVDFNFGAYRTSVLQHRTDASLVSTQLALDTFWNRAITLAGFTLLFGIGAIFGLRAALKELAANRRFVHLDGQSLRPITVQVFGADDLGKRGTLWRYGPVGAQAPAAAIRLPPKMRPFFLDGTSPFALAASDGRGEPLLLDDGLSMLKLERAEHESIQAWRSRQRGSVPAAGAPIEQPA